MQISTPGSKWQHYKSSLGDDRIYEVIGLALHSETDEDMVIYKPLYQVREDSGIFGYKLFARPLQIGLIL